MGFRFHLFTLPWTATNSDHCCCAYTAKVAKFLRMMAPRGHQLIHYGNEGSVVPDGVEHVEILSTAEQEKWFGKFDKQKLIESVWEPSHPSWLVYGHRAAAEALMRVRRGDFLLTLAGGFCYRPIFEAFPGCHTGVPVTAMAVDYGIGHYGHTGRFGVYESHGHREWCHGAKNNKQEDFCDAVIHNYFDVSEFPSPVPDEWVTPVLAEATREPYYLFTGRIIQSKGWDVAVQATADIGARLILAGQGDPGPLPEHVKLWGHASIQERAVLMSRAIACFAPTHYREPFGGVAVESQLAGTPCITTDHGAFVETVEARWRCTTRREFRDAALRAQAVLPHEREEIRQKAIERWSLEAIAPQYERYFGRLASLWGDGYNELRTGLEVLAELEQRGT